MVRDVLDPNSEARTSRSVRNAMLLKRFSLSILHLKDTESLPALFPAEADLTPMLGPSCATESPENGLSLTASLSGALVAISGSSAMVDTSKGVVVTKSEEGRSCGKLEVV
jgi:hypothetical protein